MRLCYISNPNSTHTRRWVNWFALHGHEVILLADIRLQSSFPGVQVVDLSKIIYTRIIRFPIWTAWIRRFLHQWQPDILHAHRVNSAGWLAAASGFHPTVITPWGSDVFIQPQRSRISRLLAKYVLINADVVTANSKAMSRQVAQLGAKLEDIRNVQFGVEMSIFNMQDLYKQHINHYRKLLSLLEDGQLVFCPRAITPIYNIDIILQAIPLVRQRFPKVVFAFITYNTNKDYKLQLDKMVTDLNLEANVRWLMPIDQRNELAALYHLSDVVISVPSSDGTPVSVLEAMACGRPVVCTDLAPLREYIQNGENGWLVPVGQPIALAEYILRFLDNPAMGREFGQKANHVVSVTSNYDIEMQHMETIYFQLAGLKNK
jgi:glycosyltransferase involved in cell wall biosynthesis